MDIISFNEAATANDRIGRFNANPDSKSGLVSLPKKISVGESVTIPDGRVVVHPNLEIDGTLTIEDGGELFVPFGGTLVSSDLVHPVDTIADLRNETGRYKYVFVTGYHTKDDGAFGSNMFVWDEDSTETDNGGTVIKCTTVDTGRYKLKYSGPVNVKWFGAKGDGVTDDTAAINAAINAALTDRVDISPTGSDSINPALTVGVVNIKVPDSIYYINGDVIVYDKVNLIGFNAILKYGMTGRVIVNQFGATISGFTFVGTGLSGSTFPAIYIPETGTYKYTEYTDDTLTTLIEDNTFKGFRYVVNMDNTKYYHGLSVQIIRNRVYNCERFSLSLIGDKVTLRDNSFTGAFKNSNTAFIVNQSGYMVVENNFFTPFGGTSAHPTSCRWFDNYGSIIIKDGNRFGAELISTDVSTFLTDENVSLIYNYASYAGLLGTTPNLFESDTKYFISIQSNYIDFHNASLIKFYALPNHVYIKDNYGFKGTKFDSSYNITTAKYALDFSNVNSADITSAIATVRRFVTIDVDIPSSWMYIGGEKRFLGSIFQHVNSNTVNDMLKFEKSHIPYTINATYAEFNFKFDLFPESFNAKITVVGVSSNDSKAKDIYEADLICTSIVDATTLVRTKALSLTNVRIVNSESGTGAKAAPALNALWWGGTGSPSTTIDRYDVKLRISNIGISADLTSCYCTLDLRV